MGSKLSFGTAFLVTMAAMPTPGQSFVTPQAWGSCERHTTPENIKKFFDPATYAKTSVMASPMVSERPVMERHTTPENIRKFFDPATYQVHLPVPCSTWVQKRSAPPPTHPSAKAKMNKLELIEKFKLASELNGISWDELCETWLNPKLLGCPL